MTKRRGAKPGSGMWQQRIATTLTQSIRPLTTRQVQIRCGAVTRHNKQAVTMALGVLRRRGLVEHPTRGVHQWVFAQERHTGP